MRDKIILGATGPLHREGECAIMIISNPHDCVSLAARRDYIQETGPSKTAARVRSARAGRSPSAAWRDSRSTVQREQTNLPSAGEIEVNGRRTGIRIQDETGR